MLDYAETTEVRDGGRVGFLLIHGIGGSPAQLKFLADSLHRAGHTVVCPLLSGHAGTPAEFGLSRWTEWFVSAELALERMQRDCDVIIVGGVSSGALIALRLAATFAAPPAAQVLWSTRTTGTGASGGCGRPMGARSATPRQSVAISPLCATRSLADGRC